MRGRRFVRPALILIGGDGAQRRLLADLDDKPWAAEDGERWQASFTLDPEQDIAAADGLELSVAPDINVTLRSDGVDADGPIAASGRATEPDAGASDPTAESAAAAETNAGPVPAPVIVRPDPPEDSDLPFPVPPRRPRARGVPPPPAPAAPGSSSTGAADPPSGDRAAVEPPATPVAPRPRPAANRAADLERLTARLRAAEATLEDEQARRHELEQQIESERTEARRTVAELARARAELELARTAQSEAADTAAQLDAARRDNHELRARHEALRADHDRALRALAELEEQLQARTSDLEDARRELSNVRRQHREVDSRAGTAADAAASAGHRPTALHPTIHTPPPPRTDRPINPSLRRSPWLRLLVVLVIAGVLLAVYLVLHSTVLH